ncbi:MAG: MATE family efflux transporter [Eubacterium sp.]|nr:MATE family efflux transporter [Eubacterium sp.]
MEKENKMGVLPVKRLIVSMSIPMMISMLVQALYNIVDSMFVSRLSEDALTAVTLAFPLQMIIISTGSGMGVGVNAILSRALGEKNQKLADKAACNGIFLSLLSFLIFIPIGLFVAKPFIDSQTSNSDIAYMGTSYLRICCVFSLGVFMQMIFERLLQSTGRTILSMISQVTGAVINMILDPMLIFGIGTFPEMGIKGAAYATVCGQTLAAILGFVLNICFNKEINFTLRRVLKPSISTIKKIFVIGIPSMLMMSIGSVMTYLMNKILDTFSTTAVAVFGAYFKLQSFIFMPVFGLNNGLIPVLAFNYGAKKKVRIKEALEFSLRLAIIIMIFGLILFWSIPGNLLKVFDASENMIALGVPALRIISLSFPVAGACIAMGSVFQAFAKSKYTLVISIGRQLVVLIPVAWLLSLTGQLSYVWLSFPISEVASLILSLFFFRRINRTIVDQL